MRTSKIARYGLLIALAFIFSYIENVLVPPVLIPGIKLGLANVVVVVALYRMGNLSALLVSVIRVLLSGLTFGNPNMMIYSFAGCSLSLLVMVLLKKTGKVGLLGVSLAGGVMHNIGQLAAAAFALGNTAVFSYLPVLLVSGSAAGLAVGAAGAEAVKRLPKL